MKTPRKLTKEKKPSFFKVLINPEFSTRLQIPPSFVKKYGNYLSSKVVLRNDWNECWEVEVAKIETSCYFGNGWETFVKDNALEFGDFVVFQYCCNSTFKFKMYGTTCCEKELERTSEAKVNQEQDPQNGKREEILIHCDDHQTGQVKLSKGKRTMQRDKGINSNSVNPSFEITLTSTYVNSYLAIPLTFFRKYMKMENQEIKLKMDGKMWSVKVYMNFRKPEKCREARFTVGWIQFVKENHLKERDVCIFEMLQTDAAVFHVRVHRD